MIDVIYKIQYNTIHSKLTLNTIQYTQQDDAEEEVLDVDGFIGSFAGEGENVDAMSI